MYVASIVFGIVCTNVDNSAVPVSLWQQCTTDNTAVDVTWHMCLTRLRAKNKLVTIGSSPHNTYHSCCVGFVVIRHLNQGIHWWIRCCKLQSYTSTMPWFNLLPDTPSMFALCTTIWWDLWRQNAAISRDNDRSNILGSFPSAVPGHHLLLTFESCSPGIQSPEQCSVYSCYLPVRLHLCWKVGQGRSYTLLQPNLCRRISDSCVIWLAFTSSVIWMEVANQGFNNPEIDHVIKNLGHQKRSLITS